MSTKGLMTDTTKTIVRSAGRFCSGTVLSRVTGMFRDMAMAFVFGTQEAVAAFLVAFRLAHLLRRLFGEGALQSAFIPEFESLRVQEPQKAARFFRDLFVLLTAGLSGLIVIAMLLLGAALFWIELTPGNQEVIWLMFLLMPSLLFICLFGLNASLLQCERSFFIPGVAPVAFNLIWIVGVFSLAQLSEQAAMPWLAGWVILACFCQWLFTLPQTLSFLKQNQIRLCWKELSLFSRDVAHFIKPLGLAILGVAASQVNNAVDAIFARYAEAEGPAFLWYALRIQQLPLALFGIAISGALLPPLTRALKNQDQEKFHHFLRFAFSKTVLLMVPMMVGLFILGDSCVNFIYGRGDFTLSSVVGTTWSLWGYGMGLLPMALVLILAPAYYARGNQRIPAVASLVVMGMNGLLNTWMIVGMGWGAASVALATSISSWVNLFILLYYLPQIEEIFTKSLLKEIAHVLLASLIATVAVVGLDVSLFQGNSALQIMQGNIPALPSNFMTQAVRIGLEGSCFLLVYGSYIWTLTRVNIETQRHKSAQN